jgi:NADPH:quinone reductase-like Zn-dependent oxidoreductase
VDNRSSQAEYAVVEAGHLTPKPAAVPWEVAGALPVAGFTAWAAIRAVNLRTGDAIAISGAAGGVGSLAVQLARRAGATVVGIAGEDNHEWLREHGAVPVRYGEEDLVGRIRDALLATPQVDAFIDTYGGDYVEFAINELGVEPSRVDTIVRFDAVASYGVKAEGNAVGASAETLKELAGLIAAGELEVPIWGTYPLDRVREAYAELAKGHLRGKIVLIT